MTTPSLPIAVEHWDRLPDQAQVDIKVLMVLYDRSKASIWRDCASGRIPVPKKFSPGCTRWNVGEIRKSLAEGARR